MSTSTSPLPLEVDAQRGKPPMVRVVGVDDAPAWIAAHRDELWAAVNTHGSLLVRGLALSTQTDVGTVANHVMTGLMEEKEAFASRDVHPGGLYSSTAWPAKQQMCMHHELSYRLQFPGLMLFACIQASASGGSIAVADSPTVLEALPADILERFSKEGWMLTRSYTDEIGLSFAEAFGTDDRREVEQYCEANRIDFEWQSDGGLRTRQRRSAVLGHPGTGKRCWFNQIAFLSEWTMNPEVREFLIDMYGADGLPFNTRFGNGDPISQDVVQRINDVYDANTLREPLQSGDLMLVDNVRTAHSRDPYEGTREVIVAMGNRMRHPERR